MVLSDRDLKSSLKKGHIKIIPFSNDIVRENGVDFRLSDEICHHLKANKNFILDPMDPISVRRAYGKVIRSDKMVIKPQEQVLLSTIEHLEMPADVMGFVELRSTWARHGLSMPPTIIDAGFVGTITLEVINHAPYSILLRKAQRFAHIIFAKTHSRVENAYSGTYLGQQGIKLPKVLK